MLKYADYNLREIQEGDLEVVLHWRNSEHIRCNMYNDHLISQDEHYQWFQRIKNNPNYKCLIFEMEGKPVGYQSFDINGKHNRCFFGEYIGEKDTHFGIGAAMEFIGFDYAFSQLKIHKLCCEVIDFNSKAISLHKSFGMQEEGRLIKHVMKSGEYRDVVIFAIFPDVWFSKRELIYNKIFSHA